jgi:succinate dehydrogenase / fumarate reductase cytochrome b subunit
MPGLLKASLNPWLVRVRNNPERLAFVLHRVTGVIILAYLLVHIFVTSLTVDEALWTQTLQLLGSPLNKVGEWIVAGAVIYHGLNGIRLILVEFLGLGIGRPERPKPPYIPPSLKSGQRKSLYLVFALSLIGWIAAGVVIFTS